MSRDLRLVAASLFVWGTGEGMFLYFQTLYLEEWGAEPFLIGAILGAWGVATAIAQAPAGYLADRFGARPLMWGSWILGTLAAWIMALAGSLNAFVIGLVLFGLTSAVLAPMNSYVTAVRGQWSEGRALTLTSATYHLGAVIGPLAGGLIGQRLGLQTVYLIAAGIFILSTLLILFVHRPPTEVHNPGEAPSELRRNPRYRLLLGLTLLTMFALYFAQPLTPNFLQNERGLSLEQIGLMGTLGSLGIVVTSLVFGHLHASRGFMLGQPLVAVFALLIWRGTSLPLLGIGYFFVGGYRLTRSMVLAFARSMIRPDETGLAFGLLETANAAAVILAPPVAGLLYERSPDLMYPVALAMIAGAIAINLFFYPRLSHRPSRLPQLMKYFRGLYDS
ncbi:MAG TPA: MFS transporter [Anaerolineaceae bacterium]|nr:MFS transporter [Anaerolineaceae bacterium]